MAEIPNLRVRLTNSPENVLLVRQALGGLAEAVDLDPLELNDINTAVSEACNNVVVHAYGGGEGALEVDIYALMPLLRVVVRDHGRGIPRAVKAAEDAAGEGLDQPIGGIGLPVIRALSRSAEFRDLAGGGTEVRMEFALVGPDERSASHAHAPQAGEDYGAILGQELTALGEGPQAPTIASEGLASTMALTIAPTALARAVLPRVLCALAARAHFSTDRISDTQLLADALVAQTDGSLSATHLGVAIGVAPRRLELRIGPLRAGRAGALVLDSAVHGLGPVLGRLSDGHQVSVDGVGEILALRVAAER